MAKVNNDLIGTTSGKLHGFVFRSLNGSNIMQTESGLNSIKSNTVMSSYRMKLKIAAIFYRTNISLIKYLIFKTPKHLSEYSTFCKYSIKYFPTVLGGIAGFSPELFGFNDAPAMLYNKLSVNPLPGNSFDCTLNCIIPQPYANFQVFSSLIFVNRNLLKLGMCWYTIKENLVFRVTMPYGTIGDTWDFYCLIHDYGGNILCKLQYISSCVSL